MNSNNLNKLDKYIIWNVIIVNIGDNLIYEWNL